MKRIVLSLLLFFAMILPLVADEEQVTVNRKVAVLPIYNSSESTEYEYLSSMIADSLTAALKDTGSFYLMKSGDIKTKLREHELDVDKFIWDSDAVSIGTVLEVDVLVFGFFQVAQDQVKIILNALDIQAERSAVSKEIKAEQGIALLTTIESNIEDMAVNMEQELAPFVKTIKTASNKIAVLDFSLKKIKESEGRAIITGLKNTIAQQGKYTIIEDEQLTEIIRTIDAADKDSLTGADIIRLGELGKLDFVIKGKVERIGGHYNIRITAYSCEDNHRLFTRAIEAAKSDLNDGIAYLALYVSEYTKGQIEDIATSIDDSKFSIIEEKDDDTAADDVRPVTKDTTSDAVMDDFKTGFDFSAGFGLNFNYSARSYSRIYLRVAADIPFSFTYFVRNDIALGFNITTSFAFAVHNPPLGHGLGNESVAFIFGESTKLLFKLKTGPLTRANRFIFEIGANLDVDGYYIYYENEDNDYTHSVISYTDKTLSLLYIGPGPYILIGAEKRYKRFVFEFGFFTYGAFGPLMILGDGIHEGLLINDFNVSLGLSFRWSYNYFKKVQ